MATNQPTPERWTVIGDDPANLHIVQADAPHLRVCFLTSDGPTEERARLISAAPDLKEVAARWAMAMFQSGIAPVENSDSPLESLLFDTNAALFKATGRDVVADNLEALTAGNRASLVEPTP